MEIMELKIFAGCFTLFKSQSRKRSYENAVPSFSHGSMVRAKPYFPRRHLGTLPGASQECCRVQHVSANGP